MQSEKRAINPMPSVRLTMSEAALYQERIGRLQDEMIQSGVDLTLIAPTANMRYLTGFAPMMDERFCALMVSPNGFKMVVPDLNADQVETHTGLTVMRWKDEQGPFDSISSAISQLAVPPNIVLAADNSMRAEHLLMVQDKTNPERSLPAGDLMSALRIIKSQDEIDKLARSAALADRAMQAGIDACIPGTTERRVANQISNFFYENGAEKVDFTLVASGPNGAFPHHQSGDRTLETGDPIILDIGATLAGYKSDITRMVFLGDPTREFGAVYQAVLDANQAGRTAAVPGSTAADVDRAARASLKNNHLDEYFVHRTGHGLGLEGHEPPWMTSTSETVLSPGMVFSVEPGVYLPGKFGVRIEDILVVTEGDPLLLTGFDHNFVAK
jgi:Xaa-Pro aminopeptidase